MKRDNLHVYKLRPGQTPRQTRRWVVDTVNAEGDVVKVYFATHAAALNYALWKVGAQRNYAEVTG